MYITTYVCGNRRVGEKRLSTYSIYQAAQLLVNGCELISARALFAAVNPTGQKQMSLQVLLEAHNIIQSRK